MVIISVIIHNFFPDIQVFVEDKTSLAVRLVDGGQLLKFTSPKAETIVKQISSVISKWQNEKPVSAQTMIYILLVSH